MSDLRWVKYWVGSFVEVGAADLTLPVLRRRLHVFGAYVLVDC